MKEKPNKNSRGPETAQAPSFFKIDPQNWPDLPPPVTKSKRHKDSYKLLGVARFTDPVQHMVTSGVLLPGWKNPLPMLAEPADQSPINKRVNKDSKVEEEKLRRARLQAKELMLKLQSGEVERSQVLSFYKENATTFIPRRTYESYREYAIEHKLKIMSWPEYARARILERFSEDFYSLFRKWK